LKTDRYFCQQTSTAKGWIVEDEILTAEEAAELLRVGLATLLKESRLGRLPGVKVGREWRYSKQALMQHVARYTGDPDPDPDPDADPEPADTPEGAPTTSS